VLYPNNGLSCFESTQIPERQIVKLKQLLGAVLTTMSSFDRRRPRKSTLETQPKRAEV
jgi:hypothetical protein